MFWDQHSQKLLMIWNILGNIFVTFNKKTWNSYIFRILKLEFLECCTDSSEITTSAWVFGVCVCVCVCVCTRHLHKINAYINIFSQVCGSYALFPGNKKVGGTSFCNVSKTLKCLVFLSWLERYLKVTMTFLTAFYQLIFNQFTILFKCLFKDANNVKMSSFLVMIRMLFKGYKNVLRTFIKNKYHHKDVLKMLV